MSTPRLITTEHQSRTPILIVDRVGWFGEALQERLSETALTVLVTQHTRIAAASQTIIVPYHKRLPPLPDSQFSHIFLFYKGENDLLTTLPLFARRAAESKGKCFLIVSLRDLSDAVLHAVNQVKDSLSVIVYGDVFSDTHSFSSPVQHLLAQSKTGAVSLHNEGLHLVYPVYSDDVVTGVIAAGFSHSQKQEVFLLYPPHPVTELSVFRMLSKKQPALKPELVNRASPFPSPHVPAGGLFLLPSPYLLEERLFKILDADLSAPTLERVDQHILGEKFGKWFFPRFGALRRKWLVGGVIGLVLLFLICLPLFLVGIGLWSLQDGKTALLKNDGTTAQANARIAHNAFHMSGVLISLMPFLATTAVPHQLQIGERMADVESDMGQTETLLPRIQSGDSTAVSTAISRIKQAILLINGLSAEKALPAEIQKQADQYLTQLQPVINSIDVLPSVLGFEKKQHYLLLLQNNMELRPGGGFIGSYALVDVEKGRIIKFTVNDVYNADGLLKGHIDPPFALSRYLGAAHWFLRDSNYSPDFEADSKEAAHFLNLETGEHVDGVIGIDTTLMSDLLTITGPISLPDYHETVTSNNFFSVTEAHSQDNFFPGSTQKQDFLHAFYTALLLKLQQQESNRPLALVSLLAREAVSKHLLISLPNPAIQNVFTVNDLSGSLWDGRDSGPDSINDFLGLSETNLGTNKANYYLKRTISQAVSVQSTASISATTTITYQNTSTDSSAWGGDYKNYLRIILPKGSTISQIQIDHVTLPIIPAITDKAVYSSKRFVAPAQLEVEQTEEEGKSVFGFLVIVPKHAVKQVAISYRLPQLSLPASGNIQYDLRVLKQPGTQADPFVFTFSYPSDWQVLGDSSGMAVSGTTVGDVTTLDQDKDFQIHVAKR